MGVRITSIIVISTLLYSALGINMFNIQVRNGELYRARAESQHELAGILNPKRGSIYFTDRDGSRVPVAINKEYPVIYAVPKKVTDSAAAARALSTVSDRSYEELTEALSEKAN